MIRNGPSTSKPFGLFGENSIMSRTLHSPPRKGANPTRVPRLLSHQSGRVDVVLKNNFLGWEGDIQDVGLC